MAKDRRLGGGEGVFANANFAVVFHPESSAKKAYNDAQFKRLKDRVMANYGISLDDSLREQQDFRAVRDSITGIEGVFKEFPGAQKYLTGTSLAATSTGGSLTTLGQSNLLSKEIELNDSYFKDNRTLNTVMAHSARTRFHPSGSTGAGVATHETGHLLVSAYASKNGIGYDEAAKMIVHGATKIPGVRGYAKSNGIRPNAVIKLAGTISRYAVKSNHETVAEAVSDYMQRGSQANTFSRAIVRYLKNSFNR